MRQNGAYRCILVDVMIDVEILDLRLDGSRKHHKQGDNRREVSGYRLLQRPARRLQERPPAYMN